MYAKYFKRGIDFILSLCALIVLSPVLLILIILGTVFMGGNPFFTQERPGKAEKIFKLIKFRTMSDKKDKDGNLLPDELRLNKYGKFLRASSLDELPELINILKGDMAIIGPRPLLVRYLARYNEEQHHRHDVRPGLALPFSLRWCADVFPRGVIRILSLSFSVFLSKSRRSWTTRSGSSGLLPSRPMPGMCFSSDVDLIMPSAWKAA